MLNIKKIFEKIADAGQKILENKNLKRSAKKNLSLFVIIILLYIYGLLSKK